MIRILSLSYHQESGRSRKHELERVGFKVTSAKTIAEAERLIQTKRFNVLLIGHTVPISQRVELALLAKSAQKMQVIFFYNGSITQAESADAILSADGTTEDLIAAIDRLTKKTAGGIGTSQGTV